MSAPDRPNTYTLEELTSAADVTVRTVRYYIAEGLLPPPEGAGRAARYSDEHRDRLEVIASLKERHLPLREIRRHLHALTSDELAALATESRNRAQEGSRYMLPDHPAGVAGRSAHTLHDASAAAIHGDSSALDYIRSIHETPPPYHPHVPPPHVESAQQWRRLSISPDAELMVSDDLYRRRREQIETLLAWAKHMFHEP